MVVRLTLLSKNEMVLGLVGDFAKGLGCTLGVVPATLGRGLQTEFTDAGDTLLELLSYVALTATKAGIDPAEPLCRVTYWHRDASAQVTLGLRVAEFSIDRGGSASA